MLGVCLVESSDQALLALSAKLDEVLLRLAGLERVLARGQVQGSRWYTRAEAAQLLGVSTRTVDRLVRRGTLATTRRNGHVFVSGGSVLNRGQSERRPAVEVLAL
jgi:excisionase family DNA binding protein